MLLAAPFTCTCKQALFRFNAVDTLADAFYAGDHARRERISD